MIVPEAQLEKINDKINKDTNRWGNIAATLGFFGTVSWALNGLYTAGAASIASASSAGIIPTIATGALSIASSWGASILGAFGLGMTGAAIVGGVALGLASIAGCVACTMLFTSLVKKVARFISKRKNYAKGYEQLVDYDENINTQSNNRQNQNTQPNMNNVNGISPKNIPSSQQTKSQNNSIPM